MIHDYHFYLVPEMVRAATADDLFLHFFVHIPWPHPEAWRVLPPHMRERIFRGILGSDIVGFHTSALRPKLSSRVPGVARRRCRLPAGDGGRRRTPSRGAALPDQRR